MDWVHCNSCYVQPKTGSNSSQFFLTSCGHIFCERCNSSVSTNVCRICESQYTTTQLSGQVREEVREFFTDPLVILSKLVKVLQYQKDHRDRFNAYLRRAQSKYEAAKREMQKLHEELKAARKKIHALQQELTWYKVQRERERSRSSRDRDRDRDTPRSSGSVLASPGSTSSHSPFSASGDSQRSALQHMQHQGSGMGNSRLTMTFRNSSSRQHQEVVSPLSMMPPATPTYPGSYRNSQHYTTPESTPGGSSLFPSPSQESYSSRGHSSQRSRPSPPSRGTPTDALKILSLAYKNQR